MSIREKLNNNPRLTTGITIGIIILALGLIVWQLVPSSRGPDSQQPARHYYAAENDPANFFAGDIDQLVPFQRDGKTIVRARVFRCGKDKPFVGWLEKFDPAARAEMERYHSNSANKGRKPEHFYDLEQNGMLVKKPAETNWTHAGRNPQAAEQVRKVNCPGGEKPEELLWATESK